jgi:hypothetical protein
VAVVGCTTATWRHDDDRQEQLLIAAGFARKAPSTPEQMAHLQALPMRRIGLRPSDADPQYFYADPEFCKCLYLGREAEYQAYRRLAVQRNISSEIVESEAVNPEAQLRWNVWGLQ